MKTYCPRCTQGYAGPGPRDTKDAEPAFCSELHELQFNCRGDEGQVQLILAIRQLNRNLEKLLASHSS